MRKVYACAASCALLLIGAAQGGCDAQVEPGYEGEPLTTLKGRVSALFDAPAEADVGVLWLSDAEGECAGPQQTCSSSSTGAAPVNADLDCLSACGPMPECLEADAVERWAECQRACGAEIEISVNVQSRACFSGGVGQTAPVTGNFPAQFSLDVLSPPPVEALLESDTGERVALGFFVALQPTGGPLVLDAENREPPAWLLGGSETHFLAYAADPIAPDSTWGRYLGGEFGVGYHLMRVVFGNRCGLPRFETYEDEPDSSGSSGATPAPDTIDGDATQAPPAEPEPLLDEPDYRGVPWVCGNGVCEENEDCSVCSDCIECDGSGSGVSSGRTSRDGDYHCEATPPTFVAAPAGSESEIELLIAPVERIDWPEL